MKRTTVIIAALTIALIGTVLLLVNGTFQPKQPAGSLTPVTATGDQTASVSGEIGVPSGVEAFGVTVYAEGTSFNAFTDADGKFTISGLKKGTYKFRATRLDLENAQLETVEVADSDIAKPQPFHELLRVIMDPKKGGSNGSDGLLASLGSVSGRVTTGSAGDQAGTTVLLEGTGHRTATLANGDFDIVNIEPGSYNLVFIRSGYSQTKMPITITAGDPLEIQEFSLTARVDSAEGDKTITGTVEVLTADGSPASDFSPVRVSIDGTSFSASPDSRGHFELAHLPARVFTVSASAPGYLLEKKVEVDLQSTVTAEANLVLLEDTISSAGKGTIRGRVFLSDAKGAQNGGIAVSVAGTSRIAFTDASGNYHIENVDAGTHDLVASFNGYRSGTIDGIEITAGSETAAPDLTLEADVDSPTVVSTTPADRQIGVTIQQPTTAIIQFSMNMNASSVIKAITVSPDVSHRVRSEAGQDVFAIEMDAIPMGSALPLKYGTRYTITVAKTATSTTGLPMEEDYEFSFTTGYAEIIATSPADGDSGVAVNFDRPIAVSFNAPVDPDSISMDDISFAPQLPSSANINFRKDSRSGWTTMYISGFAQQDTNYMVTIRRGVKTINGDRIRNTPYKLHFTTAKWVDLGQQYNMDDKNSPDDRRRERSRKR